MSAPVTITDPILAALIEAHQAREVYPTGHVFTLTRDVDGRSRAISVATCECGAVIKLLVTKHLEMDAAVEAHWQKFDCVEDRGQPVERAGEQQESVSREGKPVEGPDSVTVPSGEAEKEARRSGDRDELSAGLPSDDSNKTDELPSDWSPLMRAAVELAWRDEVPEQIDVAGLLITSSAVDLALSRPLLRWHGGKWKLAPWVMSHFPEHRIYVEPFGGAGSVLLRKRRVYAEVYNDLDDVVVNLFRVLRDDAKAERLIRSLKLTPFSRPEFEEALQTPEDDVERARHLIVRSYMGFGSNAHNSSATAAKTGFKSFTRPDEYRSTGFRANSNRSGTTPAHDWMNYPDALPAIIDRLRDVIIERRPAIEVMKQHDGGGTLHYVAPPYLPETRSPANKYDLKHRMYRHELTVDDHRELLAFLGTLQGFVVLSGYPSTLYDESLPEWRRATCAAHADGARERTEVLWLNPACANALDDEAPTLFNLATFDAANAPPPPSELMEGAEV